MSPASADRPDEAIIPVRGSRRHDDSVSSVRDLRGTGATDRPSTTELSPTRDPRKIPIQPRLPSFETARLTPAPRSQKTNMMDSIVIAMGTSIYTTFSRYCNRKSNAGTYYIVITRKLLRFFRKIRSALMPVGGDERSFEFALERMRSR